MRIVQAPSSGSPPVGPRCGKPIRAKKQSGPVLPEELVCGLPAHGEERRCRSKAALKRQYAKDAARIARVRRETGHRYGRSGKGRPGSARPPAGPPPARVTSVAARSEVFAAKARADTAERLVPVAAGLACAVRDQTEWGDVGAVAGYLDRIPPVDRWPLMVVLAAMVPPGVPAEELLAWIPSDAPRTPDLNAADRAARLTYLAEELSLAVHEGGRAQVAAVLRKASPARWSPLMVVLAAMVPVDVPERELLAWVTWNDDPLITTRGVAA